MPVAWPRSDEALLVWAQLLLTWVVALYYMPHTWSIWARLELPESHNLVGHAVPKLALLALMPLLVMPSRLIPAIAATVVGVALALALSFARERGSEKWKTRGAEVELGLTGAYVALSAVIVGDNAVRPLVALVTVPLPPSRMAALSFSAAITLFLVRGGTQIVRALLKKAGTLPVTEGKVDEVEYNRGRLIGGIERLLLAWMVAAGSYGAMGFIVAAKGLIRSKDLENRERAEYFLVGTLASTAVALVAGGLLRVIFLALW